MSTETTGVEGVSARYAAQIRELLFDHAVKREAARIAAEREAARAALDPPPAEPRSVSGSSRQNLDTNSQPAPQTPPVETRATSEPAPQPAPDTSAPGSRLNTIA